VTTKELLKDMESTVRHYGRPVVKVEAAAYGDYNIDLEVHVNEVLDVLRGMVENGYGDRPAPWDLIEGENGIYLFRP
jgi:hypothetical protein